MVMKRKDAPELYEVLKKSNIDITKTAFKDKPEVVIKEENVGKVVELNILPVQSVKPPITNVFPKLKSSFIKERVITNEKKQFSLSYSTAIFLVIVGILLLAASFVIGFHIGDKSSSNIRPTPVLGMNAGTNQNKPTVPTQKWAIRVVYYDNNSTGEKNAKNKLKSLTDKHITNVYTSTENIQSRSQICVYIGPYSSNSEVESALKSLKSEHRDVDFKNSKIVAK